MKKRSILIIISLLLLTSLACRGSGSNDITFTIANKSPEDVCYVFISPSDSDAWGDDQLGGNDVISPGSNQKFTMPRGTYDIRLENCMEAAMATAWEVSSNTTVTAGRSGADVNLTVINDSSEEICYVFISPSSGDDWGDDLMGEMESLPAGGLRAFYVKANTYDLMAADCDDNTLIEEYDVELFESLEWTIYD
ncbi:MAG: hypothetical protein P1S60_14175 [Anaerolineae bacterium]|nr:hypothetical protein [Anaerolineae bacterium]